MMTYHGAQAHILALLVREFGQITSLIFRLLVVVVTVVLGDTLLVLLVLVLLLLRLEP